MSLIDYSLILEFSFLSINLILIYIYVSTILVFNNFLFIFTCWGSQHMKESLIL